MTNRRGCHGVRARRDEHRTPDAASQPDRRWRHCLQYSCADGDQVLAHAVALARLAGAKLRVLDPDGKPVTWCTGMKRRPWTDEELAALRREYPDRPTAEIAARLDRSVSSVYGKALAIGLRKTQRYLDSPAACRLRRGDNVGAATRFRKGHVPWTKGKRGWKAGGRSAETRFKPGQRPQTWVPVGTEVLDKGGYRKRKIRDDAPPGMSRKNWRYLHRMLWEEHYGPVPHGHAVIFINGDKTDIRIENLALVHHRDLMRKNTVHNLPAPLAQVVQLRGALVRQINRRTRNEKQDRGSA